MHSAAHFDYFIFQELTKQSSQSTWNDTSLQKFSDYSYETHLVFSILSRRIYALWPVIKSVRAENIDPIEYFVKSFHTENLKWNDKLLIIKKPKLLH